MKPIKPIKTDSPVETKEVVDSKDSIDSMPVTEMLNSTPVKEVKEPIDPHFTANLDNTVTKVVVYDTDTPVEVNISVFNNGRGFVLYPSQRALIPTSRILDTRVLLGSNLNMSVQYGLCVVGGVVVGQPNELVYVPIINHSKEKRVILHGDVIAELISL